MRAVHAGRSAERKTVVEVFCEECMEPDSELPVKKQDAAPGVSGV